MSFKSLMESWRIWRFLTKLERVSGGKGNPLEASLKVSLRLNILNPVKTLNVLLTLFGVLEDMEVPDKAGNGVRGLGGTLGSFTKNFVKIGPQVPC